MAGRIGEGLLRDAEHRVLHVDGRSPAVRALQLDVLSRQAADLRREPLERGTGSQVVDDG